MKDGTFFWRSPAGMLVLVSVVAVHLLVALPHITRNADESTEGGGSELDPMTRFEQLGPAEDVFDAFERWNLADQTGCWIDLASLDWFGVLMGDHATSTVDGHQVLSPSEDILVGLVFANGERTALVVPKRGEVVALESILAFHFSERLEVSVSPHSPADPTGEIEIAKFPIAGAVTFGGSETCWQAIEVDGTSELRRCTSLDSSAAEDACCELTVRDASGASAHGWSFACGEGAVVRPIIVEGKTHLSIER